MKIKNASIYYSSSFALVSLMLLLGAGCLGEGPGETSSTAPMCAQASSSTHPESERLQQGLERVVRGKLPGSILHVRDVRGEWSGAAGLSDIEHGVAMKPCTPHRIASVSKSLTAVMIMRLVERGELELDAPISTWLTPERAAQFVDSDQVSVRNLLEHSSGYENYTFDMSVELFNEPGRTWTSAQALDMVAGMERSFAVIGSKHSYSNTNYLLLAEVAEGATGRAHERLLEELVFEPSQMHQTSYAPDAFTFPEAMDRGYMELFHVGELVDVTETYACNQVGAEGGVVSTAGDVGRFLWEVFDEKSLLSEASLAEISKWQAVEESPDRPGYGLGFATWQTRHGLAIGHIGQEFGYLTFAYYFPEQRVSFVFMTNASSISEPIEGNLTHTVVEEILPDLLDVLDKQGVL